MSRHLGGENTRNKAIEAVGIVRVELAERQHKAMIGDLAWALEK